MRRFLNKAKGGILAFGLVASIGYAMPVMAEETAVDETAGETAAVAEAAVSMEQQEMVLQAAEELEAEAVSNVAAVSDAAAVSDVAAVSDAAADEDPEPSEEVTAGFFTGEDGETYYRNEEGEVLTYTMVTVDEKKYWLQDSGILLKSGAVYYEGVIYRADKKGVLSVKSGWVQLGEDWYCTDTEGVPRKNCWVSGKYYLDDIGVMLSSTIVEWEGELYYLGEDGACRTEAGPVKYGSAWFLIGTDGAIVRDMITEVGGRMYSAGEDGRLYTNQIIFVEDETYYYAEGNGAFRTKSGWIEYSGQWYFLEEGGRARCNLTAKDAKGNRFYLGDDGRMVRNEIVVVDEVMYYAGSNGAFRTKKGWLKIGSDWYFTESDGSFRRNKFVVVSKTEMYFMDDVGKMVTSNIVVYQDILYYIDTDGRVKMNKGWMKIKNKWYYAIGDGALLRNDIIEYKGKQYFMGDDGAMVISDGVISKGKAYKADKEGVLTAATGWVKSGGLWYRADKNSAILRNQFLTISGVEYFLDLFGVVQEETFFYYGNDMYYAEKSGKVRRKSGWLEYDGHWFFSKANGIFYRNVEKKINGVIYYFKEDGSIREAAEYYYTGIIHDTSWTLIDGKRYHVDAQGRVDSWFGIDVSGYQDIIDWDKVKAAGVDFAFIRVGGRFMASGEIYDDSKALRNLAEANRVGIPVGVYFFSQAITEEEAIEEANYTLEKIKGYNVELPVVIDTENTDGGRQNYITPQQRTNIIKAFCERVSDAGYSPMYYAGMGYCVDGYVLYDQLSSYMHWCAQYWIRNQCDEYGVPYQIWQYDEYATIDGIYGRVDVNIWYRNY